MRKGLIQVYTGEGKGKTTAAVGQAIRAKGRNQKVLFAQFLKNKEGSAETSILERLGIKVMAGGGRYKIFPLEKLPEKKKEEVTSHLIRLLDEIKEEIKRKEYDLLILDEINVALHAHLMEEETILDFLRDKPSSLEIVLTGRYAPSAISRVAHLVSEIIKVKHPYDEGIGARRGIDY
ncbi:cob(I)yrinic acid a,c-diamide adenosyltransferase [Candidatus Aerophobetes bacterium]|uniref:Cob(I)yrinic acid a,c-diamide adenosyltransferase n=1 Tax=Aerophobetes bacterium TaxID=2030807 RepID=A0A523TH55_UNCAE|nr:MAG: cob(I)yrinic acid a,c-diamide adenosyltransferase [Candidatus Aerophobetes bacterium]